MRTRIIVTIITIALMAICRAAAFGQEKPFQLYQDRNDPSVRSSGRDQYFGDRNPYNSPGFREQNIQQPQSAPAQQPSYQTARFMRAENDRKQENQPQERAAK